MRTLIAVAAVLTLAGCGAGEGEPTAGRPAALTAVQREALVGLAMAIEAESGEPKEPRHVIVLQDLKASMPRERAERFDRVVRDAAAATARVRAAEQRIRGLRTLGVTRLSDGTPASQDLAKETEKVARLGPYAPAVAAALRAGDIHAALGVPVPAGIDQ